jgi:hypothetical protein
VLDLTKCEARVLTGIAGLLVVMLVGCLHGSKVDSFSRSLSS